MGRTAKATATMRQVIRGLRIAISGEADTSSAWRNEVSAEDARVIDAVRPYTMTSVERLGALIEAVRYVVRARVPGAIAECGVWRGGSMMAVAKVLQAEGDTTRELYLYDTFEGMPPPTSVDRSYDGVAARTLFERESKETGGWCYSTLEEVRANMERLGYPTDKVHFIRGKVEETLPAHHPGPLAILRLDTDWYESTRHELEQLFPSLAPRGVLIIDDYGHWQWARKATDEFLEAQPTRYLLNRIDYTGRILLKA